MFTVLNVEGHGLSRYGHIHNLYRLHHVHESYFSIFPCLGNLLIYMSFVKDKLIKNIFILDIDDQNAMYVTIAIMRMFITLTLKGLGLSIYGHIHQLVWASPSS